MNVLCTPGILSKESGFSSSVWLFIVLSSANRKTCPVNRRGDENKQNHLLLHGKKPSLLSADLQPILYLLYSIVLTLGHTALKQQYLPKKQFCLEFTMDFTKMIVWIFALKLKQNIWFLSSISPKITTSFVNKIQNCIFGLLKIGLGQCVMFKDRHS